MLQCMNCYKKFGELTKSFKFRGKRFCSGACNNQHMRQLAYHREKKGHTKIWTHADYSKNDGFRRWFHIGDWVVHYQIILWKWKFGLCLDSGNIFESDLTFHFAIPGFNSYLSVDGVFKNLDRTIFDFHTFHGDFVVDIWTSENAYRKEDWKGLHWRFNLKDFLLGEMKLVEETVVKEGNWFIFMPEGHYPSHYKIYKQIWKRKRWWKQERLLINFEIPQGIPHAGKGENSYDCGDDATYGITTEYRGHLTRPENNIDHYAYEVVKSITETRRRYGNASPEAFISRGMKPVST